MRDLILRLAVLANWQCTRCDTWNAQKDTVCDTCETARPVSRVRHSGRR